MNGITSDCSQPIFKILLVAYKRFKNKVESVTLGATRIEGPVHLYGEELAW
jgi:hypothetical protein